MSTFPPPESTKPVVEQINEARAIALQHRADGNVTMAEFWDSQVDRLLDRMPRRKAADEDHIRR